jgi:hypothetical protein
VFLGRVPVAGEPLWLEDDRQWAVALLTYEADLCSGCGQSRSETTAIGNEDAYAGSAIRCHGCKAVAIASEVFTVPGADARGLLIGVSRRDRGVRRD